MAKKRLRITVTGRVQGVGFRYFAHNLALELKLVGYVRNLSDGRVESEVEGEEDAVNQFASAFHKGPSFAHVTDFDESWGEPTGRYSAFGVTR